MDERPNFLVIMTDQQRGDCLSCAGHQVLMPPNMDAIGGAGIRFSRAYATCPVCVPARRSFLSGQFPSTHGVLNNSSIEWDGPSLPGVLRDAGYQTEWVGRGMHQTPLMNQSLLPLMRGDGELDRSYLHLETAPTYHCLTDGREKYIWFVADGREQYFDLVADPGEERNLIAETDHARKIGWWRTELIQTLEARPEGFSDGERLIPGRAYPGLIRR